MVRRISLIWLLVLCACASPGWNGGVVSIETTSQGQTLAGASCMVYTNVGNWTVLTPATVTVGRVQGDLRVVCDKPGYRTSELIYKPSGYPSPSVGVGVGGGGSHVGVGVGLSVPIIAAGGSYPARITIDMNPQ